MYLSIMNGVFVCVVILVVGYSIWEVVRLKMEMKKVYSWITIIRNDAEEFQSGTSKELSDLGSKLTVVGKILNLYEDNYRVLARHRDEVRKIQSRFQKREVR